MTMATDRDTPPSGWGEFITEVDDKHQRAHERLRLDFRELERTVESNYQHFSTVTDLLKAKVSSLESNAGKPIDATTLVMPLKATIAIVGAALVVSASMWALNNKIDAQQKSAEAAAKFQESQISTLREQLAANQRNTELLRYEVQQLKETVIGKGKKP